jgi:beta-lactamase superfamily II metal-dependent hydrolase
MRLRFLLGIGLLMLLLTGCRQLSSSSVALQPPPKGTLQITFFDVGQGDAALIEVKDPSRIDSDDVKRKRSAAELWCKKRGMEYIVYTLE